MSFENILGNENIKPTCHGLLHCGLLEHDIISDYLNMADVFVLPTLNEGCCNAIVEALSCGLPIISSNLPFNWDILNPSNSIMVDPNNIEEISDSINKIYEDENLRNNLAQGAILTAESLTIEARVKRILSFMESKLI